MLTAIWDSQGPVLETYLERGTVTSATYCDMLQSQLKPAVRSKIRRRLSEDVMLVHDDVPPHTAAHTFETLGKFKWEVVELPAHSPDLAPSIFHLCGRLKKL
jgi:transposase